MENKIRPENLESTLYLKNCLTAFEICNYITNDAKAEMFIQYSKIVNKELLDEIKLLKSLASEKEKSKFGESYSGFEPIDFSC